MNRSGIAKTMVLALLIAGVSTSYAADPATLNGWTIESGSVKSTTSKARPKTTRVKGSFELSTSEDPGGVRRAGACLIADLTSQGVGLPSCTSHQQCNDAYNATPHPKLGSGSPGPYLYCLGNKPQDTEKRCWIRPGPDSTHCIKNQFAPGKHAVPALIVGQPDSGSVPADPLGKNKPVPWMVFGCLNPDNNLPPACQNTASSAKVNSFGKVKKLMP